MTMSNNPYATSGDDQEILEACHSMMSTQDIAVGLLMAFMLGLAIGSLVTSYYLFQP